MHELFEHTADLGLRIEASTLDQLFAEAGDCLMAAMLDNPESIRSVQEFQVSLEGADREFLLFDWLRHLLLLVESEEYLFARFSVQVQENGLVARFFGEPVDRTRHQLSREVKAITYHELKVEPLPSGWRAEVIVDI